VSEKITVSAPARLHFGLFSIGDHVEYRFGGAGLMIDGPRTVVHGSAADRLNITGVQSDACLATIDHWFNQNRSALLQDFSVKAIEQLPVAIDVAQTPPRHSGFGSGTQLAMSVIAAVWSVLKYPLSDAASFALATGRGQRSAIGSHGFIRGGFLVDRGKRLNDSIAPLDLQIPFPENWPVVTVLPTGATGLSGATEKAVFNQLPASTDDQRDAMIGIVKHKIIPAIVDQKYDTFSTALYDFGHQSGLMFAPIQKGAYNGPEISQAIKVIREFGVLATGQSSWGPCVFAITNGDTQATELVSFLNNRLPPGTRIDIRHADNQGAVVK
jgi:beta-RFAP synthase